MWAAAFDTVDFAQAVQWFRARVPMDDGEFLLNVEEARKKAFWIAGVTHADVIRDVHDSLGRALEQGLPFHEWKKQIEATLRSAWGDYLDPNQQPDRIETILRNWAQGSYNRARWQQMGAPAITRLRPWRMFDAVRDKRTSVICAECDGTILPADDPWWDTHQPQLHHRCRSGIRSLTLERAQSKGITRTPPSIEAQTGFGNGEEWAGPDRKKFPRKVKPPKPPKVAKPKAAKPTPEPAAAKPAGKFKRGLHAKKVFVSPGIEQGDEILSVLNRSELELLAKTPLEKINLAKAIREDGHAINGSYHPRLRELNVDARRGPGTYGKTFQPGNVFSVSKAASTSLEAAQRTLVHELGHHAHMSLGPVHDQVVKTAFGAAVKRGKFLTEYAQQDRFEYFAESYAAYRFYPAELKAFDPGAFAMVEKVLAFHGVTP